MLKFFSSPLDPDEFVTKLKGFVDEEEIDSDNPTLFTTSVMIRFIQRVICLLELSS